MNRLVRWSLKRRRSGASLSVPLQERFVSAQKNYLSSTISSSSSSRENGQNSNKDNSVTQTTPVAIVGGGPSGLLLSNLLSIYRVPSVLVDGQSVEQRCSHPQAHFLNSRTMEILRHQVPRVYDRLVHREMTPVHQWKHFQFGYNMLPETQLARVDHPVDRPLVANRDANGTLVVEKDVDATNSHQCNTEDQGRPLSVCSVGHLAQHTFCRILYDAAIEEALPESELYYNTRVNNIEDSAEGGFVIHTDTNKTIRTKLCVAADGAHSYCRGQWGMEQVGQVGIQHLLNIHVKTCPKWARSYLHNNDTNFAMLYSVFHPNIVAMIVCHSVGEYVFQVPFFPPYQSLEDFSEEQVRQMVHDAMGIESNDTAANANIKVVSVKAWTMSSLIAEQFVHISDGGDGGAGYLVGDAAHVFPPAGGLGMNTGLQDVYSLAWKIAWAYHNNYLSLPDPNVTQTSTTDNASPTGTTATTATKRVLEKIGQLYEKERRPVAQANAALSVRNYNRLLEITKACYLSEQHPTLLIKALEASSSLLPFAARRDIFQRLFATATWTLSSLRDGQHPYTQHLRRNIQRILANGGGLPLLFPTAELGFGYNFDRTEATNMNVRKEDDTMGFRPAIQVGHLFPHVVATIRSSPDEITRIFPNVRVLEDLPARTTDRKQQLSISSSDLPAQVARDSKPCFVLLILSNNPHAKPATALLRQDAQNVADELGMAVEIVNVVSSQDPHDCSITTTDDHKTAEARYLTLWEEPHSTEGLLLESYNGSAWLIRPDGHVAGKIGIAPESGTDQSLRSTFHDEVMHYAKLALFGLPEG